jgi:hypothetical protein
MHNASSGPGAIPALIISTEVAHDVSLIHEKHPKIGEKIMKLWGSVELHTYMNSIIFDQRGGRQGFAEPAASALFRVFKSHSELFAKSNRGDIWDVILDQVK